MLHFCTYFDSHYLPRVLALYHSLKEHCPSFSLWGLCMDDLSYGLLSHMNLPGFFLISLQEFEREDQVLLRAKANRTTIEYYFTCTPSLPLFVFNHHPDVPMLTYLDADLFFFDNPNPIFDEIADHSIAVVSHRYARRLRRRYKYGNYNVGWISFRRDKSGLSCLHWWRERCLEWCYDRFENGRFADQKYLDAWPSLFKNLVVLEQKGTNLAPWNINNYRISYDGHKVWVDEDPLVFFHFHGFRQVLSWLYDTNFAGSRANLTREIKQHIFAPYIHALSEVKSLNLLFASRDRLPPGRRIEFESMRSNQRIWHMLDKMACVLISILHRNYLVLRNGRIL